MPPSGGNHQHSGTTRDRTSSSSQPDDEIQIDRRSLLQLVGVSSLPFAIGSATAMETGQDVSGYGIGEYGNGLYGGSQTLEEETALVPPEVQTNSATDITASDATLTGTVVDLGSADVVDCFFEWRAAGKSVWNETENRSQSSRSSFTHTVTGLTPNTEYEFRAVAETEKNDTTGETNTVTTARDLPLENTILIDGVGTSGGSDYEFTASGAVEQSTYKGATTDNETIDGGHVTGTVGSWRDAFRFGGDLESLTVNGRARVSVNDERVDPSVYGGEQTSVLTIVGNGTSSQYSFTVDGTISLLDGDSVTVATESAEGTIRRGVHRFEFTGELREFMFHSGGTQVYLDAERLDPDEYNGETRLPHALVFDGTDATGPSQYAVTTSGEVASATYRGATIDADDTIDSTTIRGEVTVGTVDAYWFAGEITDFRLTGDAAVDVEYDVR